MHAEEIIVIVIMVFVGFIMIAIGISNLRSESPVGFYSGEKPPKAESICDVKAWNGSHGKMWIVYGIALMISWCGFYINDIIGTVMELGITLGGVVLLIAGHKRLERKYKVQ